MVLHVDAESICVFMIISLFLFIIFKFAKNLFLDLSLFEIPILNARLQTNLLPIPLGFDWSVALSYIAFFLCSWNTLVQNVQVCCSCCISYYMPGNVVDEAVDDYSNTKNKAALVSFVLCHGLLAWLDL